jgi:colicin import membrane protein
LQPLITQEEREERNRMLLEQHFHTLRENLKEATKSRAQKDAGARAQEKENNEIFKEQLKILRNALDENIERSEKHTRGRRRNKDRRSSSHLVASEVNITTEAEAAKAKATEAEAKANAALEAKRIAEEKAHAAEAAEAKAAEAKANAALDAKRIAEEKAKVEAREQQGRELIENKIQEAEEKSEQNSQDAKDATVESEQIQKEVEEAAKQLEELQQKAEEAKTRAISMQKEADMQEKLSDDLKAALAKQVSSA